MPLDEGGRDESTLPLEVPRPLHKANGRLSVTMAKLLEICGKDYRMGRTVAAKFMK